MTQADEGPRPGNSPTRVLGVLGGVLSAVAVVASVWGQYSQSTQTYGYEPGHTPLDVSITQFVWSTSPSLLTGGIVCIGLAILSRAWRTERRAEDDLRDGEASMPQRVDTQTWRGSSEPPAAVASRPLDPEAFKRPRSDTRSSSGPTESPR